MPQICIFSEFRVGDKALVERVIDTIEVVSSRIGAVARSKYSI